MAKGKMRILHVVAGMNQGGVENVIMNLYRKINRNQINFDFAVLDKEKGFFDQEIIQMGGKIHYISASDSLVFDGKYSKFNFALQLFKILKNNGPFQAIHCHNNNLTPIALIISKLAKVPIRIVHSHNSSTLKRRRTVILNMFLKLYRIILEKFSTNQIGCSLSACDFLFGERSTEKGASTVIYNGINYQYFDPSLYNREVTCKILGISQNNINLFYAGRISDVKNSLFLFNVFTQLEKELPNVYLTVVANVNKYDQESKNLYKKIEEIIKQQQLGEKIKILEPRNDIPFLMSAMDIFLLPSISEGLPLVLVEAQRMGLQCFVSDRVTKEVDMGLCEYIPIDQGEKLWVELIKKYIKSGNKEGSPNKNVDQFNIDNMCSRIQSIYSKGVIL